MLLSKDRFINIVTVSKISGRQFLITLTGTLSCPGALLLGTKRIIYQLSIFIYHYRQRFSKLEKESTFAKIFLMFLKNFMTS